MRAPDDLPKRERARYEPLLPGQLIHLHHPLSPGTALCELIQRLEPNGVAIAQPGFEDYATCPECQELRHS